MTDILTSDDSDRTLNPTAEWDLDDPQLEAHIDAVWTCLYRAYECEHFDFTAEDAPLALDVFLEPAASLDADEVESLELFEEALVNQERDPDRGFAALNSIESSFCRILRRGVRRRRRTEAADVDTTDGGA